MFTYWTLLRWLKFWGEFLPRAPAFLPGDRCSGAHSQTSKIWVMFAMFASCFVLPHQNQCCKSTELCLLQIATELAAKNTKLCPDLLQRWSSNELQVRVFRWVCFIAHGNGTCIKTSHLKPLQVASSGSKWSCFKWLQLLSSHYGWCLCLGWSVLTTCVHSEAVQSGLQAFPRKVQKKIRG